MTIQEQFLANTEHTGRFIIKSPKTGISYFVEPIDPRRENSKIAEGWGDVNPASGKVEGDYGSQYKGSIKETQSLLTEENGFKNIQHLGVGVSPAGSIEELDNLRYEQGFRPK
jgi:hypothetical protein